MEQSVFTLKQLNEIAAYFNLELVEAEGYFFWMGIDDHPMGILTAGLDTSSVYIYSFDHLTKMQWLNELKIIINKIMAEHFENR